ncbi:type II toxin-antitoxin system RelE/ParE family toxin [Marinomonas aquiplantarum]|uniref:Toxin n=1 Tax=Marinomonas aquiplantarum TaxID=491951 RepID=A0A366D1S3_9GAMM|nr:type II toxin-antitoxin system RelE/ParE family toxin [Marinomonas aquiplantarum]RBO83449.1 toxin ParE1/3/4 [Marinomonas aquiplantarum]
MADKYTYSKLAEQDLIDIYLYTAQTWGRKQADVYSAGIEQSINRLADSPNIGRACNEIKTSYRRFEHKYHTIFYRQRQTGILIVRILHESMDIRHHISG